MNSQVIMLGCEDKPGPDVSYAETEISQSKDNRNGVSKMSRLKMALLMWVVDTVEQKGSHPAMTFFRHLAHYCR